MSTPISLAEYLVKLTIGNCAMESDWVLQPNQYTKLLTKARELLNMGDNTIVTDMATSFDNDTFDFSNPMPDGYSPIYKPDYTSDDVNYDK